MRRRRGYCPAGVQRRLHRFLWRGLVPWAIRWLLGWR
jgi:hypothetical protein